MLPDYRTYQGTTKLIPKDQIYHHGILGMHWGIRRFQPYPKGYKGDGKEVGEAKRVRKPRVKKPPIKNKDGSLTDRGRGKYKISEVDRRLEDNKNKMSGDPYKQTISELRRETTKNNIVNIKQRQMRAKVYATSEVLATGAVSIGLAALGTLPLSTILAPLGAGAAAALVTEGYQSVRMGLDIIGNESLYGAQKRYLKYERKKELSHSAKGSTWEEHKYIKRIDGTYYYPDDYEGGRHLPDGEKGSNKGHSEYKEYDENDPDFADSNWNKAKRIGDTDFHYFQRDDGRYVILEEDMKWVLPEGTEIDDNLIERLQAFDDSVTERRKSGKNDFDWSKEATAAINGSKSSDKLSDKDIENLAKEVVRGNFGNGKDRKELLGDAYADVQKRVNELMKDTSSSEKKEAVKEAQEEVSEYVTNVLSGETYKKDEKDSMSAYEKRVKKVVKHSQEERTRIRR